MSKLDSLLEKKFFPLFFIPIAFVFLLFYSYTTSPIFVDDGFDSAIFKTMGFALLKGKVLYVDIFDHKGPVVYFFNALGQLLLSDGRFGIFILQTVGLSISMFFWYKTTKLIASQKVSFWGCLLTLFLYAGLITEGNQVEDWMLPFISASIFYAIKFSLNSENSSLHPIRYSLIYGMCFGMVFFIRPNDAVAIFGGIWTGLIWIFIQNKDYRAIIKNGSLCIVGFILVAAPICLYFLSCDAIDGLYNGLIKFNTGYSGGLGELLTSCFRRRKISMLLIFIALGVLLFNTEIQKKNRLIPIILPILFYEYILSGGNCFWHYYTVLLPLFSLYIVLLLLQKNKSIFLLSLAILILSEQGRNSMKQTGELVQEIPHQLIIQRKYGEAEKILLKIPTRDKDSVWCYNPGWAWSGKVGCSFLWKNGIVQCNKITCAVNDDLLKEDNLQTAHPKWITICKEGKRPMIVEDSLYVEDNYTLISRSDTSIIMLELWQRKEIEKIER